MYRSFKSDHNFNGYVPFSNFVDAGRSLDYLSQFATIVYLVVMTVDIDAVRSCI